MPETDLKLLTNAAQQASVIALKYWKSDQRVIRKPDNSPVSEGDLAVDKFLREYLTAARPDYGWISEETEDDKTRLSRDSVFIVDPIDGTRAYVDGQTTWAHSIAVTHKGRPTAAVIYLPAREKLYTAAIGQGAHLNGQPITTGTRTDPDGATVLAPKPSLDAQYWRDLPALERHFRPALAYRFCLVAEGRFDVMLTLKDAWEWDIAAGTLIAEEAGAVVTDRDGQKHQFNGENPKSKGVFTAAPDLHKALMARYI